MGEKRRVIKKADIRSGFAAHLILNLIYFLNFTRSKDLNRVKRFSFALVSARSILREIASALSFYYLEP